MPFQRPLLLYDDTARELERRFVRRMYIDDALVRRGWRLERVWLNAGREHYRLYRGAELVGVVDVTTPTKLSAIQHNLAAYLAGLGFTPDNARLIECGAKTRLEANKWYVDQLFSCPSQPKDNRN
jgi:hypothetical protein